MNAATPAHQLLAPFDDPDPQETAEWCEALAALVQVHGPARARTLLDRLAEQARELHVGWKPQAVTLLARSALFAVAGGVAWPAAIP